MTAYQRGYKQGILALPAREISTDYLAGYRAGKKDLQQIQADRATPKQYRDKRGLVYLVSDGISQGKTYMTVSRRPGQRGSHRVSTHLLPLRKSPIDAQEDLDVYAALKEWQRVQEDKEQ